MGGNNVVSRHFLAVVELDARAQMVEIFPAIVVDLVGLAQLRLDVELRVERDERFIDVAVGDDTHGRVGDHHRVKRSRLQIVADMQLVLVDNVFRGRCLLGLFRAGGRGRSVAGVSFFDGSAAGVELQPASRLMLKTKTRNSAKNLFFIFSLLYFFVFA